jgi:hypothetical protein
VVLLLLVVVVVKLVEEVMATAGAAEADAIGLSVTVRLCSAWAPTPLGHHRATSLAVILTVTTALPPPLEGSRSAVVEDVCGAYSHISFGRRESFGGRDEAYSR